MDSQVPQVPREIPEVARLQELLPQVPQLVRIALPGEPPPQTDWDLGQPSQTDWDLRQPFQTDWDLRQPSQTDAPLNFQNSQKALPQQLRLEERGEFAGPQIFSGEPPALP